MRIRLFQALALVTAGVVVGLAGGELLLRWFRPQIFELHPRGLYTEDPDVGYVLTPGFAGTIERSEFRTPLRIGRSGLRAWDGEPADSGRFRIVVLGDSFAFGFGVCDDETLTANLASLLARGHPDADIEILNGAVPGYGTADELAFLKSRGEALKPDLVIVQFLSVNDLQESRTPVASWAAVEDGMLVSRDEESSEATDWASIRRRWHRYLKKHSHLARLISDTAGYWMMRMGIAGGIKSLWGEDFTKEDAVRGAALLEEIAATARSLGATTVFLYTTGQAHVMTRSSDTLASRAVVKSAAESAGVTWIDVSAAMGRRADRNSLYFRKDGHWTPQGHRAAAEIVAEHLVGNGLITVATGTNSASGGGVN